jgi:hypothetical protein
VSRKNLLLYAENFVFQLKEWRSENFHAIATSMLSIASDNETEAFFLAKGLARVINRHSVEVIEELIQTYHRLLSSSPNTTKLYR